LLKEASRSPRRVTILTGTLAAEFFADQVTPRLQPLDWLDLRIVGIPNTLYGTGITVAGLLSGEDFAGALRRIPVDAGTILLPDTPINHEERFLDDLTLDDLRRSTPHDVRVARDGLVEALLDVASDD